MLVGTANQFIDGDSTTLTLMSAVLLFSLVMVSLCFLLPICFNLFLVFKVCQVSLVPPLAGYHHLTAGLLILCCIGCLMVWLANTFYILYTVAGLCRMIHSGSGQVLLVLLSVPDHYSEHGVVQEPLVYPLVWVLSRTEILQLLLL